MAIIGEWNGCEPKLKIQYHIEVISSNSTTKQHLISANYIVGRDPPNETNLLFEERRRKKPITFVSHLSSHHDNAITACHFTHSEPALWGEETQKKPHHILVSGCLKEIKFCMLWYQHYMVDKMTSLRCFQQPKRQHQHRVTSVHMSPPHPYPHPGRRYISAVFSL